MLDYELDENALPTPPKIPADFLALDFFAEPMDMAIPKLYISILS